MNLTTNTNLRVDLVRVPITQFRNLDTPHMDVADFRPYLLEKVRTGHVKKVYYTEHLNEDMFIALDHGKFIEGWHTWMREWYGTVKTESVNWMKEGF